MRRRHGDNSEDTTANNAVVDRAARSVLRDAEFFFIKQRADWAESFTGIEEANQYTVYDERNQEQFKVVEHKGGCTECITRQCLKDKRQLTLFVTNKGKLCIKIFRKYICCFQESVSTRTTIEHPLM